MSKPLVIIGNGGLSEEIISWIIDDGFHNDRMIGTFISNDQKTNEYTSKSINYFEDLRGLNERFDYIIAISKPLVKKKLSKELNLLGGLPFTFIHKSSTVSTDAKIGKGVVINPNCSISPKSKIGEFVLINCNSSIGHDVEIGDNSSLLGSNTVNGNVIIGRNVVLGSGSIIHPRKKIADNAVVGIGSIVIRDVKQNSSVFGNPAKQILKINN